MADVPLNLKRNECCATNSYWHYIIRDWYEGSDWANCECEVCGNEWWFDWDGMLAHGINKEEDSFKPIFTEEEYEILMSIPHWRDREVWG